MGIMDILNEAFEIAEIINESTYLKRLRELRVCLENDQEIKRKIKAFEEAKKKYYETLEFGAFYPEYKVASEKLVKAKTNLYKDKTVEEYKEIETMVQDILDEISLKLKRVLSEKKKCNKP